MNEDATARRRIARIKQPDIRAIAYFMHEMRNEDGVTIRAALKYLADRYYRPVQSPAEKMRAHIDTFGTP